jgi:hypothetical protein
VKFALNPPPATLVSVMKSTDILLVTEKTSSTGPDPVYTAVPKENEEVRSLNAGIIPLFSHPSS